MAVPVLLDCDPGHDDAIAIMLAAGDPAIDLLGITTVAGNQTLPKTTLNARRVCTAAGISTVPIAAGRAQPLHSRLLVGADIHGETGLDGPAFGEPTVQAQTVDAIEFMRQVIIEPGRQVTLIATGPLTNVAALMLAHPEAAGRLREIVVMGTMCGLNVTHQALATADVLDRIAALGTPLARICVDLLTFFADSYRRVFGFSAPPVHDPVAVARVIDPAVVTTVETNVAIELAGPHTRGATVVDLHQVTERQPNAQVAVDLDTGRFWDLVVAAIAALG